MENVSAKTPANNRVLLYDWLRLIATVYVVIGHSTYLTITSANGGVFYDLPAQAGFILFTQQISGWMYRFHMPLFFLLSGAVLALRPVPSLDALVRSKTKRLLLPFFACGLFFMIPVKLLGGFYQPSAIPGALNAFFTNTSDTGHLWFLLALFWCMIAFCILEKGTARLGFQSIYLLLILSWLIFVYGSRLPFDVYGLKSGLQYLLYFTIGYIYEKERSRVGGISNKCSLLLFIVLFLLALLNEKLNMLGELSVILSRSFLTISLADICNRFLKKITVSKAFEVVVRNLFCVYLFHDPLEYVVLRLFFTTGLVNSLPGCLIYWFCRTVVVFTLCVLLGELLKFCKSKLVS